MKRLLLLFAVAVLASCSNKAKDLDSSIVVAEPDMEVGFTASISSGTRVANDCFENGNVIAVQAYEAGDLYDSQAYTYNLADDNFTAGEDAIVRTNEEQELSYIAAYPSTVSGFGKAFDFSVAANQAAGTEMSDLLVAIAGASTDTEPELTFYHAMSSLVINFNITGDDAANATANGVLKIYSQATAAIDLSGEAYSATATGANVVELTPYGNTTVIFAPQTLAAGSIVAVYTVGDQSYTWRSNNDLTFNSAIRYTYTWSIDTSNVDPEYEGEVSYTGEINGWNDDELTDNLLVTFDLAGGEIDGSIENIEVEVGTGKLVADPGTPEKIGCTFAGWVYGTTTDEFTFDTPIVAHTTITATWVELSEFTVSFDLAGGSYSGDASDLEDKTINRGEPVTALTGEVTKEYSTFVKWVYGDEDAEFTFGVTQVYEDMTITAVWDSEYDYVIATEADLIAFRNAVNDGTATAANVILTDDITIETETNWTPIGSTTSIFTGTFDGNYKSISDLTISASTTHQGLFGAISGATIKNCTMKNVNITSTYVKGAAVGAFAGGAYAVSTDGITLENLFVESGTITGGGGTAGIIGTCTDANITTIAEKAYIANCGIEEGVTITKNKAAWYVGGITGYITKTGSEIVNCYNKGTVFNNNNGTNTNNCGGIAGTAGNTIIVGCYNAGTVKSLDNAVAGIVGQLSASITLVGCYNTGTVEGVSSVGAMAGQMTSAIKMYSCYTTGDITGTSYTGYLLGNFSITGTTSVMQNCYYIPTAGSSIVSNYGEALGNDKTVTAETDEESGEVTITVPSSYEGIDGYINALTDIAALNLVVSTMNANTTFSGYDYMYAEGANEETPPTIVARTATDDGGDE